jgi:hypothetical protein
MMVTQFLVPTHYWDNTDTQLPCKPWRWVPVSCRRGNRRQSNEGKFVLFQHVSVSIVSENGFNQVVQQLAVFASPCCVAISSSSPSCSIFDWASTAGSTRPARLPVEYEDWDSGVVLPSRLSCKSILFTVWHDRQTKMTCSMLRRNTRYSGIQCAAWLSMSVLQ